MVTCSISFSGWYFEGTRCCRAKPVRSCGWASLFHQREPLCNWVRQHQHWSNAWGSGLQDRATLGAIYCSAFAFYCFHNLLWELCAAFNLALSACLVPYLPKTQISTTSCKAPIGFLQAPQKVWGAGEMRSPFVVTEDLLTQRSMLRAVPCYCINQKRLSRKYCLFMESLWILLHLGLYIWLWFQYIYLSKVPYWKDKMVDCGLSKL